MSADRKFEADRYRKGGQLFLDSDMEISGGLGIYNNSYQVYDRDKPTGITVAESGSTRLKTREQAIRFHGNTYPRLRDAIFAYEDSLTTQSAAANTGEGK